MNHRQLNPCGGTVQFPAPRNSFGTMFDSFSELMKEFYRNGSPTRPHDSEKEVKLREIITFVDV